MRTRMLVLFATASFCTAQKLPKFEQFAEAETFTAKPAPPLLKTPAQRSFHTAIREGAAKGPNFAGHYTIVTWGCGSGCVSSVVVNAKTGAVHSLPFSNLGMDSSFEGDIEPLLFKLNSRLLIARGCPGERDCATYYYEWTGDHFRLIEKSSNKRTPAAGSLK